MNLARIYELQKAHNEENLDLSEISEIEAAFDELVKRGVELRDLPENALVGDMLDELEAHASKVEVAIYQFIIENDLDTELPSYDLAAAINSMSVIGDAKTGKLGFLLGDLTDKEMRD